MKLKMTTAATMAMMASTIRISTAFTPKSINRRVVSNSFRVFSTVEDPIVADASSSIYEEQAEALAKVESPFLQIMRDRGFLHQCTNLEELDKNMMDKQKEGGALAAYLGFDATADSLHVGSLLQIMILRHLQKSGHKPIVLIGGGTSKVGDPTGKDESRKLLDDEMILKNTQGISKVFEKFLIFEDENTEEKVATDAIMVNNDDWLSSLKYLEFLRDYGTQFTVNRMLSFESVKQRLTREAPFSFLEFNYMILQAYDFLELSRRYDAKLQLGGSDQWGNIISGTELGRRCDGTQLFGLTAPLITTSDGKKMGKTANGAVWLNADRLSEYDYWQFWRNTADDDVIRFAKLFTELPLEEIEELSKLKGADINKAKIVLANEATALLHGRDCLQTINETVDNMFKKKAGSASTESLPRIFAAEDDLADGVKFLDLFLELKLANSKKEARRLIQGGGAKLGEEKITDENGTLTVADFKDGKEVILRAGKKRAGVVEMQ
jgi:tyrosyl-tRNA synthetase